MEPEDKLRAGPAEPFVENETRRIGAIIFRRLRRQHQRINPRDRLEAAMMRALMHDEELRYRMLRFVDVYPALHDAGAVSEHLQEYLDSPSLALNGGTRLLAMARRAGRSRTATQRPIAWASRIAIETMGKQFIAGDTPCAVAARIRDFEQRGFLFTLDLLGEFVASEQQADEFGKRYRDMIDRMGSLLGELPDVARKHEAGPRVNLSIKLSSLTSHFDAMDAEGTARTVLARLRPLFRAARARHAFINIDMEKFEYRDMTIEIVQRLLTEDEFRGFADVGLVMQAYLRDAEPTLRAFLDWLREHQQPMTIRLVKGAYWDSEQIWANQKGWPVPVLTDKQETDAQFERMTRQLLENHDVVRTAIGSHNVRSIARAIALKRMLNVPDSRFEIQMLFGMAGPIAEVLRATGLPIRIYMPCGELVPGMAYLVRRILENTSNESFLRQRFVERVDEESLLANPSSKSPSHVVPA